MLQRTLWPCLALFAALLSGCISTGGGNINARVDRHEQQIQTLLSQVGQVEQVLPGQAEMWSQMQTMRQEINMLTGKIDDLQLQGGGGGTGELAYLRDKVARLEAVVRQMASQLAVNVDSLNVSSAGVYAPPPAAQSYQGGNTDAQGETAPPDAQGQSASGPEALYDTGIKAFDQRRYKDAVVSFKDFVAAYPKHKLAANAHFWEGESWFQIKDYPRAIVAYQEVISKFPGSPKLQSAMLKQGISLHNNGKKSAAKERLQEILNRYPNSPEATRAKQFLAQNK
jgi:tol-pal system protein YbgF